MVNFSVNLIEYLISLAAICCALDHSAYTRLQSPELANPL